MSDARAWRLSVAPMMDWTDRHCRFFLRQLSTSALLYTEMVTAEAILRGDRRRLLGFRSEEHPVALQLGGADAIALAECANIGADYGYDEINLNVGCPSDRVQSGRFGACLMREPDLVARCVEAMSRRVGVPVTVKSRIAVDDQEEWPTLEGFAAAMRDAGAKRLVVHARKAWLKGLSPKENRTIPPLRYDLVYRLKQRFPELPVVINGGIDAVSQVVDHLTRVDGVMIGRAAYHNPWLLAELDRAVFGSAERALARHDIVARMAGYIEEELRCGTPLRAVTRHMIGLFQGLPGARAWRRCLSEEAGRKDADARILFDAVTCIDRCRPAAAA